MLRLGNLAIRGEVLLFLSFGGKLGFISGTEEQGCLGRTTDGLRVGVSPTVSVASAVGNF